jgi:acyl-coenzyme A thioesterase PaaI-like protein
MNVTDIPFNAMLGIRPAPEGSGLLLELPDAPCYRNHVGTVHAAAQLALAEAASGELLMRTFPELQGQAVALLRRVESKFSNPMTGAIYARPVSQPAELRPSAEPLMTKGRALIPVTIAIVDRAGNVGMTATFEWFARKLKDA